MTPRVDPALRLLEELARADEAHAAALEQLDGLAASASTLRERADRLADFLARAPAERERLETALAEAESDESRRRATLEEAAVELAEAERRGDEERLQAARRFHVRAADALRMAEKRALDTRAERLHLAERLAAAEAELPELEARAATLAAALRDAPRVAAQAGSPPRPGLAGVSEWASGARAALLVARTGVVAERDGVVRQANELGSAILGEPLVASSVATVAGRVARVLPR